MLYLGLMAKSPRKPSYRYFLEKEMEREGFPRLEAVGIRIGELTDIVPESLEFGFDILIVDTLLAGAKLKIERVPVKGTCRNCACEFAVENLQFLCPSCGGHSIKTTQGQELDICFLEIEESIADEEKITEVWPG